MEDKATKTMNKPGKPKRMRTITLEEHFGTPAFMEGPGRHFKARALTVKPVAEVTKLIERLCDIGDLRIAEMDAAGVDVQAQYVLKKETTFLVGACYRKRGKDHNLNSSQKLLR